MASLKEIKVRIASIRSTQKITAAMKMVSSAKLHHTQTLTEHTLLYANKLSAILNGLLDAECDLESPYTEKREVKQVAIAVFSSSSGLCGTFNANVWKELSARLHELEAQHTAVCLYPIGKKMGRISTKSLERELSKHPLIDEAECYKTPSGKVCVEVTQRIPILRVMSANGENYYLDNKGTVMPPDAKCVAHRVIVTGNVEKSFAMKDLYKFGVFLHNNKFWDAQIEQIHVLPDRNIELVPRVGDHLVYLGKLDDFEDKLARLKEFYKKGLNKVGWNKYSRINLEFSNQIICTKRER